MASPYSPATVVFKTDTSISDRGFNMSYTNNVCGGLFHGPIDFIASPRYASGYQDNMDCAWLLEYEEGQQIELSDFAMDLAESHSGCGTMSSDFVLVRNGGEPDSPVLWTGCSNISPQAPLRSMSNRLWITFHSDSVNDNSRRRGFSFRASAVQSGCGGIIHGTTGNISSPGVGNYPDGVECIWEINSVDGFYINLNFFGRFDIEDSPGCVNDYFKVVPFDSARKVWLPQNSLKFCGREPPLMGSSYSERLQLTFHSNRAVNGDGFNATWSLHCGGVFSETTGYIQSPGYPTAYSNDLNCRYTVVAHSQDFLILTFEEPFELETDSRCRYDRVRIEDANHQLKGQYCGTNAPPPVSVRGNATITFVTDGSVVSRGFRMHYILHQCGGQITEQTEIHSPAHPDRYFHNTNCTWTVIAPPGRAVEIKFNYIELEIHRRCRYDFVAVFEGDSLDSSDELGRYCGNQTTTPPVLKSVSNVMTIQFRTDSSVSARGFSATTRFTYGQQQGCGGYKSVGTGQSVVLQSLDADSSGQYEPDLNCQWLIVGADDKVLQYSVSRLDIESEQNGTVTTCWDYMEVRDGNGPYSPLMGHFCGSTVPQTLTSSTNFLWVKFYSDSTTEKRGFAATVSNVDPICGSNQVLNATIAPKIITSLNYPNAYPPNIRCRWEIVSPENERVLVKFTDFHLEPSPGCRKDKLKLSDVHYRSRPVTQETNSSLIVSSYSSRYHSSRFRKLSYQNVDFCGTTTPHDFYSYFEQMQIDFASDSDTSAMGFRLEYSIASCNRTYSNSNSRIVSPRFPSRTPANTTCVFNIAAPAGKTISIYFQAFSISGSNNCTRGYLEVRNGNSLAAPVLAKLCGWGLPPTIHSSGNSLWFKYVSTSRFSARGFDFVYTTTSSGMGCGGTLYATRGVATSPNYPQPHAISSRCEWILEVPPGQLIELNFPTLSFGNQNTCQSDYLELYEVLPEGIRRLATRFCGNDDPAPHLGTSNAAALIYVTSTNNTGAWRVQFMAATGQGIEGSRPQAVEIPTN